MEDIYIVKISSGDLIIGKTSADGNGDIENPLMIAPSMQQDGRLNIQFLPLYFPLPIKPETNKVFRNNFLTPPIKAPADLEKAYIQYTTGLTVASPSDLANLKRIK